MKIHSNFIGGNICIEQQKGDVFYLKNELRDTTEDWFYWAFCVENAQGKKLTFKFSDSRIGYFGPAVSHDLEKWEWLGEGKDANSFTYTFGTDEDKVYFAHSMLYHPNRFNDFCKKNCIEIKELCKTKKNRSVPYISFGSGERIILLTARHHACESSGSYVLEGVLDMLLKNPIRNSKVICIPFVDFDGVVDGDQGKSRFPYDHNRDYDFEKPAIYSEVAVIRAIADKGILYGFDFHSPWHCGNENDKVFIVQKCIEKSAEYEKFGKCLENSINENAFSYRHENDILPGVSWNSSTSPCFGRYMNKIANADVAFTLETAYFGTKDNVFSQSNSVELGRCFAKAIKSYDEN